MTGGLIGILIVIIIIFLVDKMGEKVPQTIDEIRKRNKEILCLLDYKYDFVKDKNFQPANKIKKKLWYVSDCDEYYHVIEFGDNNIIMMAADAKDSPTKLDYSYRIEKVEKQLYDKNNFSYWTYDVENNLLNIKFSNSNDPYLSYRIKVKVNGVLVIKKRFMSKRENCVIEKEHQYLEMKHHSFGQDWSLILRDSL